MLTLNKLGKVFTASLSLLACSLINAAPAVLGDLDEDGLATVFDLTRLIAHLNDDSTLQPAEQIYADLNGDSRIDQIDVQLLRDAVLLRTNLPEPTYNYLVNNVPENVFDPIFTFEGASIPGLSLLVEGGATPQTTVVNPDGSFSIDVPLKENQLNRLYLTVFDELGNASPPRAFRVTHDSQAPNLFIDFPLNNSEVFSETVDIAGRVGDMLSGYRGLDVTVQGASAEVIVGIGQNGSFERSAVPLEVGKNIISVTAKDALGNTITKTSNIFRRVPEGPLIQVYSGNNQEGTVDDILGQPASVRVSYPNGSPVVNKLVNFKVIKSNGMLAAENDMTAFIGANLSYQARTDSQGIAQVYWRMGHDAGCGNNRLQATSKDVQGTAYFCASANPDTPSQINIGSGNNQRAAVDTIAVEPLRVWVNDSCNGVEGINVTYKVVAGGGTVNGAKEVTVQTSRTGHAGVEFRMGPEQGNNFIEATFSGNPNAPARFVAYGLAGQDGTGTVWEGIIFDNSNNPVGGATCQLEIGGVFQLPTTSDADGVFRFRNLPSGAGYLHINGLTADTLGGEEIPVGSFPSLHYEVVVVENALNSLGEPVLLPPLDPVNARVFDNSKDLVLTCEGIEGLKMTIKAGSMRLPDGTKPDWRNPAIVSLNQVHHDDAPMPMPDGVSPPFAWTLQPSGSTFSTPVKIEYPNMKGLAPGAVAYFLSYDHDIEEFVIAASGHVSDDGSTILTDPEVGLFKAGWGCNCPPYSVTTDCEGCKTVCIDRGSLSGGSASAAFSEVCFGETMTFTMSNVTDSGGRKRTECEGEEPVTENIPAVAPTYTWEISRNGNKVASGSGQSASTLANAAGTYTCVFTAEAKRACAPSAKSASASTFVGEFNCGEEVSRESELGEIGEFVKSKINAIPYVEDAEFGGEVKGQLCDVCCEGETIEDGHLKLSGSVFASATVSKTISPLDYKIDRKIPYTSIRVKGELSIGPFVTLKPKVTVGVSGFKNFAPCNTDVCVAASGDIEGEITVGGKAVAEINDIGVEAELSATGGFQGNITYDTCDGSSSSACFRDIFGNAKVSLLGYEVYTSNPFLLVSGNCN